MRDATRRNSRVAVQVIDRNPHLNNNSRRRKGWKLESAIDRTTWITKHNSDEFILSDETASHLIIVNYLEENEFT